MRYAKRNLRIVGIGTAIFLAAAVISLSSHTKSLRPVIQAEEQNGSALETTSCPIPLITGAVCIP